MKLLQWIASTAQLILLFIAACLLMLSIKNKFESDFARHILAKTQQYDQSVS